MLGRRRWAPGLVTAMSKGRGSVTDCSHVIALWGSSREGGNRCESPEKGTGLWGEAAPAGGVGEAAAGQAPAHHPPICSSAKPSTSRPGLISDLLINPANTPSVTALSAKRLTVSFKSPGEDMLESSCGGSDRQLRFSTGVFTCHRCVSHWPVPAWHRRTAACQQAEAQWALPAPPLVGTRLGQHTGFVNNPRNAEGTKEGGTPGLGDSRQVQRAAGPARQGPLRSRAGPQPAGTQVLGPGGPWATVLLWPEGGVCRPLSCCLFQQQEGPRAGLHPAAAPGVQADRPRLKIGNALL